MDVCTLFHGNPSNTNCRNFTLNQKLQCSGLKLFIKISLFFFTDPPETANRKRRRLHMSHLGNTNQDLCLTSLPTSSLLCNYSSGKKANSKLFVLRSTAAKAAACAHTEEWRGHSMCILTPSWLIGFFI